MLITQKKTPKPGCFFTKNLIITGSLANLKKATKQQWFKYQ